MEMGLRVGGKRIFGCHAEMCSYAMIDKSHVQSIVENLDLYRHCNLSLFIMKVDYTVTEGCDSEGWQYAADFPATYYDRQGLMSYVRRRRWTRSCRLTAYGPWKEIGGDHHIKDVSMQVGREK